MDTVTRTNLDNIFAQDRNLQNAAYYAVIDATDQPVDWAYEVWDELLRLMKTGDNHQRTIAVQVLSNLAKSDPEQKMIADLDKLMLVTKDEKFVTARHSLQCLWKIGIVNDVFSTKLLTALTKRFKECALEKNCTLIRYDIIVVIRKVFDIMKDKKLQERAIALIHTETDENIAKNTWVYGKI